MDSGGSPALAESEADGVVSSSYQRRLFAERAGILVVFSFASASLVVLVAVLIPWLKWNWPVMALSVAGMACALVSRHYRFKAALNSSRVVVAAFAVNLLFIMLALLAQLVLSALRM